MSQKLEIAVKFFKKHEIGVKLLWEKHIIFNRLEKLSPLG